MSIQALPVVVLNHKKPEHKHQEICDSLKQHFADVSIILNEPLQDGTKPFYWIIYTENELLNCLHSYPKCVPIGYKLLLRYLQHNNNNNPNNKTLNYLTNLTQKLFNKLVICTSGIHNEIKNNIKTIAHHLGGKYDGNFTDAVTHLIETKIGSEKHKAAVLAGGKCKIVAPQWIYSCYISGKLLPESKYCPPLFYGYFISVTGIKSTEREQIKRFITQYGGEYCQGLSQQCTHLIANNFDNLNADKSKAALEWNIPILQKQWFYDYLQYKGCVDHNKYKFNNNITGDNGAIIKHDDGDIDIDIGEDTELRDLMHMIDNHKYDNVENIIAEDGNCEDLCYLENCVVLLLCLGTELKKEATDLIRRGKGTSLTMYHFMGTHVITSNANDIKLRYNQCFDHCTVVNMDWLRHCSQTKSVVDARKYNLLSHKNKVDNTKNNNNVSQTSITTAVTQYNLPKKQKNISCVSAGDDSTKYSEFIADCLSMNVSLICNKNVFVNYKFNISKLSLNEQSKICKLIRYAGGVIVSNNVLCDYLVCCNILSSEYESMELEEVECVSIIWIYQCLYIGKIVTIRDCISYLPELLTHQQTNTLLQDLSVCISQFDNKLFERHRIRNLLYETSANYSKTFHPNRCQILICKQGKGPKYEAAKDTNVAIVNYLWLIDSIKNGKQMDANKYKLLPAMPQNITKTANNNNNNSYIQSIPKTKAKAKKRNSSILGDIFDEGLLNAVSNCRMDNNDDNNNDLCSPALTSTLPPKHSRKSQGIIEIDIENDGEDTIDFIELDNPMDDITNFSTKKLRDKCGKIIEKKEPSMEGIDAISPIKPTRNPEIVIFCHRSIDRTKQNSLSKLITATKRDIKKAKSFNKNVTHYMIDIELTDKTKEMRKVKERQKNNLIEVINSKWIYSKLKEMNSDETDNKHNKNIYKNSITRARKRKYKDLDFKEENYDGEEIVIDEIDGFDNDNDIFSKQSIKPNKKRRKINNNGDIRKHITMTHKIGVLLTGIGGQKKLKYEEIIKNLNGVVMDDEYAECAGNEEINFKYIVAGKLVRSEKIIVGIIGKKIIMKGEYLDACKRAKKWLPYEPYCWMNDDELLRKMPDNGNELKVNSNDECEQTLKTKVDLLQAIRFWTRMDIENNCFYKKNIFIWLPSTTTYYRILRALGANVFIVENDSTDLSIADLEKKLNGISKQNAIEQVYVANHEEVQTAAKNMCKNDKSKCQKTFKAMMKKLSFIAKFWSQKHELIVYDSDFILDWTLEGCVFNNSDVRKNDYTFSK